MKKIFLILFLALTAQMYAANYIVSGAGNSDLNGTYVENGTANGLPKYEFGMYTLGWDGMKWALGDMMWEMDPQYYTSDPGATPPSTGWTNGGMGMPPAPTVEQDGKSLSYSSALFTESSANDGTIINTAITITCNGYGGESFTGTDGDNFVSGGKVVVTNLPSGLTATVTRTSSTTCTATLSGTASSHNDANDVTDLTFAFQNSAFLGDVASAVSNATKSDLEINFFQEYSIGSSGDYASITAALSAFSSFNSDWNILNLAAETFTENNLQISNLTIRGQGAGSTIVQGAASQGDGTGNYRVFICSGTSTIEDITVRYGNYNNWSGAGIYNGATLTVNNCKISNNNCAGHGAGIYNTNEGSSLTINNSTISDNVCSGGTGSAVFSGNYTTCNLTNSTIVNNVVTGGGYQAALYSYGATTVFTINNSTVYGNDAGLMSEAGGTFVVKNSLLAGNTDYDYHVQSSGALTDNGYNIVQNQTYSGSPTNWKFNHANDILFNYKADGSAGTEWTQNSVALGNQNLNISGTLADNNTIIGTQTLALSSGSFAIDAGTDVDAPTTDQRGFGRNGTTDIGSYEYGATPLPVDNALSFDGNNDYVDLGDPGNFDFAGNQSFTIELWFKSSSANEVQTLFGKNGYCYFQGYFLRIYQNVLTAVVAPDDPGTNCNDNAANSIDLTGSTVVNDGLWHHAAFVVNRSSGLAVAVYLDGNLEMSGSNSSTNAITNGDHLGVGVINYFTDYGGSQWNHYFSGSMDELRIWNTARTQLEIASNKNNINLSPSTSGLVAYYQFNQGTAAGTNTGITSLTDATSSGFNGTLTNFSLNGSSSNWVTANTGTITTTGVGTSFTVFSNTNFALRAESGTVDANFELISSSPQNTPSGARFILHHWDISSLTGPTKIRLYYTASQRTSFTGTPTIYHYTGGVWVALPTEAEGTEGPYKYVETTNYYSSFSPVAVGDANAPLPVELISFTAAVNDDSVSLNWQTATEVNNYGFEIERQMLNQVQNDKGWEKIGFTEGHGNSNSPNSYQFVDNISESGKYLYRLKQIDTDGSFEYSDEIEVEFESLPTAYELAQNYPNPFNPSTVINFQLPNKGFTSLKVYDILGREVDVLVNEEKVAGKYSVKFDASNLASGIYFTRLNSGDYSSIKKMLLVK